MGRRCDSPPPTDVALPESVVGRVRLRVFRADGSDHATIYYFLQSIFQGPSAPEYCSSLEDPFYEPCDRLLLRRGRRLAAHVRVTHRAIHLGAPIVPAAGLDWLAVAPEHRNQGLGLHLLKAAERRMEVSGAVLGMLRTTIPRFFRRTGWALCGQPSWRRANARAVLARLWDRGMIPRPRRRLHIRPWLLWEQGALARIYNQNVAPAENDSGLRPLKPAGDSFRDRTTAALSFAGSTPYGPLERTKAYWQWLLKRRACEQVYVALEGPEQLEMGEISTRVVGYAATRGEQIVELMAAPDCPRAAAQLLARCCGDAIEYGGHHILLHAPPCCPLFEIFDEAGGCGPWYMPEHGESYMMRILDPVRLLGQLSGQFDRRVADARLHLPLELGLLVDGQKYQLEICREGVNVTSQRIGRSYLRLNVADFTRLVLGQLNWDVAISDGRLECSTALACHAGRALFPSLPLWRPLWDEMPALA
jgi:predicted N-acetyltransferase YhbS